MTVADMYVQFYVLHFCNFKHNEIRYEIVNIIIIEIMIYNFIIHYVPCNIYDIIKLDKYLIV